MDLSDAAPLGYDSVMIDASEVRFDVNVERTRRWCARHRREGGGSQLGSGPKVGADRAPRRFHDARAGRGFVTATGVILRVAVGSAHGYTGESPRLPTERIAAIRGASSSRFCTGWVFLRRLERAISAASARCSPPDQGTRSCTLRRCMTMSDDIDLRRTFRPPFRQQRTSSRRRCSFARGRSMS
jgi:hypothetical protein